MAGRAIRLTHQAAGQIRIGQPSGLTLGATTTCRSYLAESLVPGMPPEFARATLTGMLRMSAVRPHGFHITIDRAGYDEVDSSEYAFDFSGGLLVVALLMRLQGKDLNPSDRAGDCQN